MCRFVSKPLGDDPNMECGITLKDEDGKKIGGIHFWNMKKYAKDLEKYVPTGKKAFLLSSFFVYPSHQKKGYGKKIIEHIKETLNGCVLVLVVAKHNAVAIGLYKHEGFYVVNSNDFFHFMRFDS